MRFSYDLPLLRRLIEDIHRLTGISISILDGEGRPLVQCRREDDYCSRLQQKGLQKECARCDGLLLERCKRSLKLERHLCHAGLYDSAMPLIKEGAVAGFILMGRVRGSHSPKKADPFYQQLPLMQEDQLLALYDLLPHILFSSGIHPERDSLAKEIASFIEGHLSEDLRVETIAAKFHLSKNTLYRRFGHPINEYIARQRLERAKALLAETDLSIREIGEQVGLEPAYFSRLFKKYTQMAPLEWRKNQEDQPMNQKSVVVCSDLHLCHRDWYGPSSEERLEEFLSSINEFYARAPFEQIFMLGDYSLDFWAWDIKGCYLNEGKSYATQFFREFASRLPAPYLALAGNHEQYGEEKWQKIAGNGRSFAKMIGGWLFIGCDNFSGNLDPSEHSDGTYTPTDLAFIKEKLQEFPDAPAILMAHWFELTKEPQEFFDFLQEEKRITLLLCGHDHLNKVTDLAEHGADVSIYHDGNFSYTRSPKEQLWGFCALNLSKDGVEVQYIEPATALPHDPALHHPDRIQNERFFKRRDISF